jgi:hypothetical protein
MTQLVTIDAETFYDRSFSLSKISTEAYVRSSQFEPIGLSLKINDAPGVWYPKPEVNDLLRDTDWSDSFIIAQNTAFDGAILNWRYGVNPKGWMDTLGMSRALYPHEKSHSLAAQAMRHGIGQKGNEVINALGKHYKDFDAEQLDMYAQYCINDGELTYKLFKLYMGMGFPRQELELIDLTLRMFIEPALVLDKGLLETHLGEVKARKLTLLEDVRDMMLKDADPDFVHTVFSEGTEGIKKLLMSNEKFADVLRRFNVEPPMKKSLTTGKMAYAFAKTDEGFTALAEHENFDVQGLVAARLGTKTTIEESRTERFIEMADRGAFPVPLRYYGAATGRWSGCLVADTVVTVYDIALGVVEKRITDVLADDLVWDGVEFVVHEGVQFSGYQEVISWDNVTGTPNHVVFTDVGEISLQDAMQGQHRIQTPGGPSQNAVDAARLLAHDYEK